MNMKTTTFIQSTPFVLRSPSTSHRPCCPILTRISPMMGKKRPGSKSKSKSKPRSSKQSENSTSSTRKARSPSATPPSISSQSALGPIPPPESDEPFIPRGPTMKAEYERRGLIEPSYSADAGTLPEYVASRMIRRIVFFAGIPLSLLFMFFGAYFVLKYKYDITVLPVVVAFSTLGTVGLATAGISYGILSSSWDDDEGSLVGFEEAKTNFFRAREGLLGTRQREKDEDELDRIDQLIEEIEEKEEKEEKEEARLKEKEGEEAGKENEK